MTTVRDASFDLFRSHGITTIFGNPGSTELPMLHELPSDFRYVLGLQEAVAVGMADGYAQAKRETAHVNLHTAPGLGNAMGAIFNAKANKAPLLVTAGQQVRAQMTMQANLTNADATRVADPFVKWSYEPPRAEDVPAALARGIHMASLPPAGPVLLSAADGRLDGGGRRRPRGAFDRPRGDRTGGRRPRDGARAGGSPRGREEPGDGRGPGRRLERRLGRRGRPRRAAAAARVGDARAGRRAARVPRGPRQLPRRAAAGDRPGRADARGPRPRARGRHVRLPLLPLHPGAGAARGRGAGGDHERSRTRRRARRRATRSWRTCG